jgi:superfamily II DNA or RNA helicase
MHVRKYLRKLRKIECQKQKGTEFEIFSLIFLANWIVDVANVWLLKDTPLNVLKNYNLTRKDIGADGFYLLKNGKYGMWQAKCLQEHYMTYERSNIHSFLTLCLSLSNFEMAPPVVISTCKEISKTDQRLSRHENIDWIFYYDLLGIEGEKALAELQKETFHVEKRTLRPYQQEDFTVLSKDLRLNLKEGTLQKFLFQAPTGYGKTVVMAEFCMKFRNKIDLIFIVAPKLAIARQTRDSFKVHFAAHDYSPHFASFDSERQSGVFCTTDTDKMLEFIENHDGNKIITTTYDSYQKLLSTIKPCLVIFDEAHRLKQLDNFNFHSVAFTATPHKLLVDKFSRLVSRTLGWGINADVLSDYYINTYVFIGDEDDKDNILMKNNNHYYARLIKKALLEGESKKMLVVCPLVKHAEEITRELHKLDIVANCVTSQDSADDRKDKEEEIHQSSQGVLVSVKIYQEGVDLPWLDSLFITTETLSETTLIQILGRIVRKEDGKTISNVYIPVLAENKYTVLNNPAFQNIANFLEMIALHDPDIFEGSTTSEKYIRKLRVSLEFDDKESSKKKLGDGDESDSDDDISAIEDEILDKIRIVTFNKKNYRMMNQRLAIMAAIIRLFDGQSTFAVKDLKKHAKTLHIYAGGDPKMDTSDASMSRVITTDFMHKKNDFLERVKVGVYKIKKMKEMKEIVGDIPDNFPL